MQWEKLQLVRGGDSFFNRIQLGDFGITGNLRRELFSSQSPYFQTSTCTVYLGTLISTLGKT